ncbi:hypothetical protein [Vibrio crassostreae]|uniref:hypothetical protein n=1 Tax=Vibrio crassostreae TaxID=246167 RepID=UPI001B3134E6|nr:hypothetical protein [Vibrio crassostreae]
MIKEYKDLVRKQLSHPHFSHDKLSQIVKTVGGGDDVFTHLESAYMSLGLPPLARVASREKYRLIEALKEKIVDSLLKPLRKKVDIKAFDDALSEFLCLHPNDIESTLGCSTTERRRWFDEGLLTVGYVGECKYGLVNYATLYSVVELSKKTDKVREQHKANVKKNRSEASKKAAAKSLETRKKNAEVVSQKTELLDSRKNGDKEDQLIYLAMLTQAASRYAKTPSIKSDLDFYRLKGKGLAKLIEVMRESPEWLKGSISESFYKSDSPHRTSSHLCEDHFEEFREVRKGYVDYHVLDFIEDYPDALTCKNCAHTRDEWYYSLYYLSLDVKGYKFGFHTPHSMGKEVGFGDRQEIPSVIHIENEDGMYRFGKPMELLDSRALPPEVLKMEIDRICN